MLPTCFAGILSVAQAAGIFGVSVEEVPISPPPPPEEDVISGILHLDFNAHFHYGSPGPSLLLGSGSNSLTLATFHITEVTRLSFQSLNISGGNPLFTLTREDSWQRVFRGKTNTRLSSAK